MEPVTFAIKTEPTVCKVLKDATVLSVGNNVEKMEKAPGDIAIFT